MFNLILSTMRSNDKTSYTERLDFLFREFIDLKFVMDPEHELKVVSDLIYHLASIALCKQNSYVNTIWQHAYNIDPFDLEVQPNMTYRNYADQMEVMIEMYSYNGGELEMIRMTILYAKSKGMNIKKYFLDNTKKLEIMCE